MASNTTPRTTRRSRIRGGRDMNRLLADFGHDLPAAPIPAPSGRGVKDPRLFRYAPRHGARKPGRGWSPTAAPVSAWRMTSDQAPVLWPFISAPGLPPTGAQMGIDQLSGGSFYADPLGWVLREELPVTNPNIFSFGKPGLGKSATTKAFCNRMLEFGYRVLILGDPKDEYERLCRAYGVEPFVIGHGLPARINPLAKGPLGQGWDQLDAAEAQRRAAIIFARWLTLVRGLVGSMRIGEHRVPFGPTEAEVVKAALESLTGYARGNTELAETTIPQPLAPARQPHRGPGLPLPLRLDTALPRRDPAAARRARPARLRDPGRAVRRPHHRRRRLERPDPVAQPLAPRAPGRRGRRHRAAVSELLGPRDARDPTQHRGPGDQRIVVRDESWRQLRLGPEAVKSFDADLRLSRGVAGRGGDIQFAVAHKPSDLLSAGDVGSQATTIAKDLLHLADIKILHGQKVGVARELDTMLGLGPMAQDLVTGWAMQGKGRALWLVGESTYKVQTVLHPVEMELTYTNEAIEDAA